MSNFTKSKTAKFIGFAVAVLMFAGVAAVPVAHALTLAELVELFIALEIIPASKADAARSALAGQGGGATSGTACPYTWTVSLKQGSTGTDVMKLQQLLNGSTDTKVASSGAGSPGSETSTFGPATKAAVMKWQDKYKSEVLTPVGLSAGTGYFGTMSIAKANALCTGTVATPAPTPTTPVVTPSGTGLTVTKHPTQPANMLAPKNSSRVPFTKVQLTASSDGAVTVNSIVVERQGQASNDSIAGVLLMNEDGTLIGIEKTLNTYNQAVVGTDFVVPAGTTRTVIIGANMNSSVGSQAGETPSLALVSINTSSAVYGSLPIVGATHTVNNNLAIGSLTVARGAQDPGAGLTKEVGTTGFTFAGIKLTAGSNEDLTLKSVRWYQSGSAASGDLLKLKTIVDGTEYEVLNGTGKYYTTVFPAGGIIVKKGFSKDISIKGDVGGGSARTIDFDIDRRTDIHIVGNTYSYGIRPDLDGTAATADGSDVNNADNPYYDASQHTISVGSMQVSSWTVGVPAQNVAENVLGQPIAGFTFDVKGEPISVSQMIFKFTLTSGDGATTETFADITNVTLSDQNGAVLAGPNDGSGTDGIGVNGSITLSDTIVFPVGITNVMLKAKLGTNFGNNDTVQASTTPNSTNFGTVTGQVTGNTITPSPTSAVNGPIQTVKAGSLTISVSSQPSERTVIAGSSQFEFARYIFDAGASGEDIKVTSVPLYFDTAAAGAAGTRTDLSNCKMYDDAVVLNSGSNILNPSTSDTASTTTMTFDGTGLLLAKGTAKTLSLKCDIKTGVTNRYWWGIDNGGLEGTAANSSNMTSASGVTSGQTIAESIIDENGQRMTAAANGSYTVRDEGSLFYRVVRAGATDVVLAKLVFTAGTTEDVDLKQIAFQLGSTTLNQPADLVGEKATVWKGTSKVGDIQFNTGIHADFATSTLSTPVRIVRGEEVTLTIKADLTDHNADYLSATNEPGAVLQIDYDGGNNGLAGNYVTGVGSGQNISGADGDITTNGVRIFENYPSVEDVTTQTALVADTLYRVKVTAHNDDVAIGRMSFDVVTSAVEATASTFKMKGPNGFLNAAAIGTTTQAGDSGKGGGTAAVGATGRRLTIDFDNTSLDRYITAGESKVYELQLQQAPALTAANTETMSIRLLADSAVATSSASGAYRVTTFGAITQTAQGEYDAHEGGVTFVSSSTDRFVWSPNSTSSPTESFTTKKTRRDWTNSYGIPGFPSLGSDMPVRTFSD
ncbi:MAG: hypothetical protein A3D67_01640 [Candidatus Lloydbacteria bacterium RIFCSPHIGHO2_02_FULL_51_22]|uniref:Peptidoglycan binding-like domain-containing protein n=3 Tax=Candidatus Lloydiibacteriota TaxID=1817910 RepID=A0A1G2D8H0_9BACT|nr:MAG: hypothetical protein A3D67_01640 [Candidatus Lloydbacteria bacterium RIFCSPHIGHO2_02_FULL_51_22]OGZ15620.1 MAG: hypothetical protein A3J08_00275 [Candidatus Lloydbacteria bacterium RIFCSPLOWO2_02_FULL_51_11]